MPTPAERAAELRTTIDHHNHKYYVDAAPEISDLAFDKLLDELIALEKKHPELVVPDSPTQRVGGKPIEGFDKVTHRVPMMSIDKCTSADDLKKFDSDIRKAAGKATVSYTVELKIDGVSMSLLYVDGLLTTAATRGDGSTGDDVTHNIKTLPTIPIRLKGKKVPKEFEVRGEVYMTRAELVRINAENAKKKLEPYANTRNLTAGTLKLLDPKECAKRKLNFFAYGTGFVDGLEIPTQMDLLKVLTDFGFAVNTHTKHCNTVEELIAFTEEWNEKRHDLPFDTDGLVVKLNEIPLREKLGATSKAPRWARAYKYEAEQAMTKLGTVEFSVGKFGELTPVAQFDPPVQLAGTKVSRASMHNASWVEKMDVRFGDTVVVEKANDIIPQVVSVVKESRTGKEKPITWPKKCPVCGAPVEKDESPTSYGFYCGDVGRCPAQVTKRIVSFARRERMDVEGLGEEVAKQLVDSGLVKSVPDVYRLTKKQLLTLEKFAETKAQNLLNGIEASKGRGLARLLPALTIYGVGESMAELLAEQFPSMDVLFAASEEELAKVKGFGPKRAKSVYEFLHTGTGPTLIEELRELGVKLTQDQKAVPAGGQPLAGKTVVVTGTLEKYDRNGIEALIKELGGKATGSVSKNTDYLVAGESAGSKLDKAKALNVPVLTEAEFLTMVGR